MRKWLHGYPDLHVPHWKENLDGLGNVLFLGDPASYKRCMPAAAYPTSCEVVLNINFRKGQMRI